MGNAGYKRAVSDRSVAWQYVPGRHAPAGANAAVHRGRARQFPPNALSRPATLVCRSHVLPAALLHSSLKIPPMPVSRFACIAPSDISVTRAPAPSGRLGTSIRQRQTLFILGNQSNSVFFPDSADIRVVPREPCPSVVLGPASPATGPALHHRRRRHLYPSYRYATIASIRCTSVLKLRSFTCWLFDASIASGSVSTHSFAGTSADSFVYARMLNTVGSSITGRNVTVDTICFRIFRISAWISLSGFAGALEGSVVTVQGESACVPFSHTCLDVRF